MGTSAKCVTAIISLVLLAYPSASHRVKGHSHIPDKSALLISDFKNSSSGKPGRSSQSGTHPAPGASRTMVSSAGGAEKRAVPVERRLLLGAKAQDAVVQLERINHFILLCCRMNLARQTVKIEPLFVETINPIRSFHANCVAMLNFAQSRNPTSPAREICASTKEIHLQPSHSFLLTKKRYLPHKV